MQEHNRPLPRFNSHAKPEEGQRKNQPFNNTKKNKHPTTIHHPTYPWPPGGPPNGGDVDIIRCCGAAAVAAGLLSTTDDAAVLR